MLDAKSHDNLVIIPTEPIDSIPRPQRLIEAFSVTDRADPMLDPLYEEAIRDTIAQFEATGSAVITDGEQLKYHNFGTYRVDGRRKFAIASWKRAATFRSNSSARRTTAAFLLSAMMLPQSRDSFC